MKRLCHKKACHNDTTSSKCITWHKTLICITYCGLEWQSGLYYDWHADVSRCSQDNYQHKVLLTFCTRFRQCFYCQGLRQCCYKLKLWIRGLVLALCGSPVNSKVLCPVNFCGELCETEHGRLDAREETVAASSPKYSKTNVNEAPLRQMHLLKVMKQKRSTDIAHSIHFIKRKNLRSGTKFDVVALMEQKNTVSTRNKTATGKMIAPWAFERSSSDKRKVYVITSQHRQEHSRTSVQWTWV